MKRIEIPDNYYGDHLANDLPPWRPITQDEIDQAMSQWNDHFPKQREEEKKSRLPAYVFVVVTLLLVFSGLSMMILGGLFFDSDILVTTGVLILLMSIIWVMKDIVTME